MKKIIACLLLAVCRVYAEPPAPEEFTVDSANAILNAKPEAYQAVAKTFRVHFVHGTNADDLTYCTPWMRFATGATAAITYTSQAPVIVSLTNGIVDFPFDAQTLNWTGGLVGVCAVGVKDSNGETRVWRQGSFIVRASPFGVGVPFPVGTTNINCAFYTFSNAPWDSSEILASRIFGNISTQAITNAVAELGIGSGGGGSGDMLMSVYATNGIAGMVDNAYLLRGYTPDEFMAEPTGSVALATGVAAFAWAEAARTNAEGRLSKAETNTAQWATNSTPLTTYLANRATDTGATAVAQATAVAASNLAYAVQTGLVAEISARQTADLDKVSTNDAAYKDLLTNSLKLSTGGTLQGPLSAATLSAGELKSTNGPLNISTTYANPATPTRNIIMRAGPANEYAAEAGRIEVYSGAGSTIHKTGGEIYFESGSGFASAGGGGPIEFVTGSGNYQFYTSGYFRIRTGLGYGGAQTGSIYLCSGATTGLEVNGAGELIVGKKISGNAVGLTNATSSIFPSTNSISSPGSYPVEFLWDSSTSGHFEAQEISPFSASNGLYYLKLGYNITMTDVSVGGGLIIGNSSTGGLASAVVGYSADGGMYGSLVGNHGIARNEGAGVGFWVNLANRGSGCGTLLVSKNGSSVSGYSAFGDDYSAGSGAFSFQSNRSCSLGYRAWSSHTNVSLGTFITNTIPCSVRGIGSYYADGGSNIYFRKVCGSGDFSWSGIPVLTGTGSVDVMTIEPLTVPAMIVNTTSQKTWIAYGPTTNSWMEL